MSDHHSIDVLRQAIRQLVSKFYKKMRRILVTLHAVKQTNIYAFRSLLHQEIPASQNVYLSQRQEKKQKKP